MGTGDPKLTPEDRRVLLFHYPEGERPDNERLRAIEAILRRITAPGESSLHEEVDFALGIVDRLDGAPTEDDLEDLCWSLLNILDMPYGTADD